MVDPEHGAGGEAHDVEDASPEHAEFFVGSCHSVFVEGDVSGFVTDDEAAHLGDGWVFGAAVLEHHLVIHVADYFCEDEGAEFKTYP